MKLAWTLVASLAFFAGGAEARPAHESLADCQGPQSGRKAPYTAACSGKSECLPSDILEIKPLDARTVPLKSVCLKLGADGGVLEALDTYDTEKAPQPPLSYALAPAFARWLGEAPKEKVFRAAQGVLLVDVILVDREDVRYKVPLQVDMATLWSGGKLPLRIASVTCDRVCSFDGTIVLGIPELRTWLRATNADLSKLKLLVNGVALPGLTATVAAQDSALPQLRFRLQRDADKPESVAAWNALLKRALGGDPRIHVAVADEKGEIAQAHGGAFEVEPRAARFGYVAGAGAALIAGVLVLGLLLRWKWIRDSYGIPGKLVPDEKRCFSLGRSQMLWWTCIVALAWFTIGRATGDWTGLNESSLILLGISVGTAVGAMATAPDYVTALVTAYNEAKKASDADPTNAKLQADLTAAEHALKNDTHVSSSGFLKDIASDYGQGTGLHRLQNILFTLAFGAWFLWVAFNEGAMPTLSATMLTLMGISGSAYVGFKLVGK